MPTSKPARSDSELVNEMAQRLRRLETRFTRYLADQGFDTQTTPVNWKGGVLHVPSPDCSLKEAFAAIPADHPANEPVEVCHKLGTLGWMCNADPSVECDGGLRRVRKAHTEADKVLVEVLTEIKDLGRNIGADDIRTLFCERWLMADLGVSRAEASEVRSRPVRERSETEAKAYGAARQAWKRLRDKVWPSECEAGRAGPAVLGATSSTE
jgi:hypothetical protein